jgi:hypothetical protein
MLPKRAGARDWVVDVSGPVDNGCVEDPGACGAPPSRGLWDAPFREDGGGYGPRGASLACFAGVERDSSSGREVERARAADRSPKMSPTGFDRSTRLNVKGVFFRFLERAVGVRFGVVLEGQKRRLGLGLAPC